MDENGHVYAGMIKVMYVLPQAEQISNDYHTKNLTTHGYCQCRHTPGLLRHKWRTVNFSLVVDYFVVKYVGAQYA